MAEKLFHIGVKALITNASGQILLFEEDISNHSLPTDVYWDLAGGRIEEGESAVDTLRREVNEETGITELSNITFRTAVISNHRIKLADDQIIGLALMVYSVVIPEGATIRLSSEHTRYEWVEPAEAQKRLQHKYPKEFTDQI